MKNTEQEQLRQQLDARLDAARALYEQGRNDEAAAQAADIAAAAQAAGLEMEQAYAVNTIGICHFNRGELERAMEAYLQAFRLVKSRSALQQMPFALNVGIVQNAMGLHEQALGTYRQLRRALKREGQQTGSAQAWAQVYTAMGNTYLKLQRLGKAQRCFRRSLHWSAIARSPFGWAISLQNISAVCLQQAQWRQALAFARSAALASRKEGFRTLLVDALLNWAQARIELYRPADALRLLLGRWGDILREEAHSSTQRATYHELLYRAYKALQAPAPALRHLELWREQYEQAQRESSAQRLSQLQLLYERERQTAKVQQARADAVEMELQALRSQLNPHFLFNALHSVQSLLHKGQHSAASEAIGVFADLLRGTLQHSSEQWHSLQREEAFLQQYLQLAGWQLGEEFSWTIDIDAQLEREYTFLPTMLLQPLVENAILHGLRHLDAAAEKRLHIQISPAPTAANTLHIAVDDNGIGRQRSADINARLRSHAHRSFAQSAIQRRIDLLRTQLPKQPIHLDIVDKVHADGSPLGTRVELFLPCIYE